MNRSYSNETEYVRTIEVFFPKRYILSQIEATSTYIFVCLLQNTVRKAYRTVQCTTF